ncbi:DUF6058 family natural product biosynthesis protein [Rugamonas apoptosis]|uniref:Uncharacterized protein n=1 Tax=Rugamonas apoptosis TaxID=2758570 RepID=A0A7W2ILY7_9BURK|nr:DUF6058 family natural product biosynthesis protein [Rugamonas apoptosis]MBA5689029.1 hypothetical protein [Rugamonas apoptosis]
MSELDVYLSQHFFDTEQMANASQLSVAEFLALVRERLVPGPSYVVSNGTALKSYVFGEMATSGAKDGSYFHPATTVWVERAMQVIAKVGREQAGVALRARFADQMQAALAELNASTWRLPDCFAEDGTVLAEGIAKRMQSIWAHFMHGTFGLCVANPVSEGAIARKEVLQEKLTALSTNGTRFAYSADEALVMLDLIDEFADSAMPFSPIEYPVSSRKRLVENLAARIRVGLAA